LVIAAGVEGDLADELAVEVDEADVLEGSAIAVLHDAVRALATER
jgi:hypothetical protein